MHLRILQFGNTSVYLSLNQSSWQSNVLRSTDLRLKFQATEQWLKRCKKHEGERTHDWLSIHNITRSRAFKIYRSAMRKQGNLRQKSQSQNCVTFSRSQEGWRRSVVVKPFHSAFWQFDLKETAKFWKKRRKSNVFFYRIPHLNVGYHVSVVGPETQRVQNDFRGQLWFTWFKRKPQNEKQIVRQPKKYVMYCLVRQQKERLWLQLYARTRTQLRAVITLKNSPQN